jgi:hypothetical protein
MVSVGAFDGTTDFEGTADACQLRENGKGQESERNFAGSLRW